MYFLINESDNSVNCHSTEPFPDFMVHKGIFRKELPVDHLPEDTNWYDCFWDPDTDTIKPGLLQRITHLEFQAWIDQQQQMHEAITQQQTVKYQTLVSYLASLFPNDPKIKEILSDGTVTEDELQQIENMLNTTK